MQATLVLLVAFLLSGSVAVFSQASEAPPNTEARYVEAVLEAMVAEGVISRQQADSIRAQAQSAVQAAAQPVVPKKEEPEYKLKDSGHILTRWNDPLTQDGDLGNPAQQFSVREVILKLAGRVSKRMDLTIELGAESPTNAVSLYTFHGDVYLDDQRQTWLRVGQAKVPYGFELLQSNGARLPLERSDVRRFAIAGERDLGAWVLYTPDSLKPRFERLHKEFLSPGDHGLVSLGVFQGQGRNTPEANENKHFVARLDYPFEFSSNHVGQAGVSYYSGLYVSGGADATVTGFPAARVPAAEALDQALNFHFYVPPDPLGVQVEVLMGRTAGLNQPGADPATWSVASRPVSGWYGQIHYRPSSKGTTYLRYEEMDGYRKRPMGSLPSLNVLRRWCLGYVYDLDSRTSFTIEYDTGRRNGAAEKYVGLQMRYRY